ncbi:MAG: hypothetical protein GY925_25855 [Actinomycetia bacterium]|nr:hypothetical protein [Actinomycetes bacterium]
MDAEAFRDGQIGRVRARRRRSQAVAAIAVTTLLLITSGVFSIAQASKRITDRASVVHLYDELVQSVTVARTQLGFSIVLAELASEAEVNVGSALSANQEDIDSALARLDQTAVDFDSRFDGLSTDTADSIDEFTSATTTLIQEFAAGFATPQAVADFTTTHNQVRSLLDRDRSAAIGRVANADATVGRLGTLLSFVVAFVIPTVALFVYTELTRPRRDLETLEATARESRGRNTVVRALSTDLMSNAVAEGAATDIDVDLRRDIASLSATLDVLHRQHDLRFEPTTIDDFLTEIAQTISDHTRGVGLLMCTGEASTKVNVDRSAVGIALDWLTIDAIECGATNIECHVRDVVGGIEVTLTQDGVPRRASEVQLAIDRVSVPDRLTVGAGGASTAIAVACELIRASGGSLGVKQDVSGGAKLIIFLPAAKAEANAVALDPSAVSATSA